MQNSKLKSIQEIVFNATKYFKNKEFCCSEAVFLAVKQGFALKADDELVALASGFCGGIGGTKAGHCGALTGAILAFGLAFGRKNARELRENSAKSLSAQLFTWFLEENATTICKELLLKVPCCDEEKRNFCLQLVANTTEQTVFLIQKQLVENEQCF